MRRINLLSILLATTALSACSGGESAERLAAAKEAEGKAIGGACRHAGRAIEDCYALNKKADKASVFSGWRDMNDYMRENKIEPVSPQLVAKGEAKAKSADVKTDGAAEPTADGAVPEKKPAKPAKTPKSQDS
jgi:hypothetical protein